MEEGYVKQGYLHEDFRMFHILDHCEREQKFHYHDFYKIVLFISGNVTYNIEGKSYRLRPYDIVLISPGNIHKPEYTVGEPYERVIFFVSEDYFTKHAEEDCRLEKCFALVKEKNTDVLCLPALVNTMLVEIIGKLEQNRKEVRFAQHVYADALFTQLMVLLNRTCLEETAVFERNAQYNQKTIDIIRYINEHLKEELSIEILSEHFYISKYHMMRQFKEETGYTIHNYITEKRILAAQNMILAGTGAMKACYECGFQDYSAFSRAFKSRMHKKPSEL